MEMEKISQEELNIILDKHKKCLNKEEGGKIADLFNKDCSDLDFSNNDLRYIWLVNCNLSNCNLSNCNLEYAYLTETNLTETNLTETNLTNCNLKNVNLRDANLTKTNLTGSNLENADLIYAKLKNVKGSITTKDYMKNNFKFDKERNGYIVYKTFGSIYDPPKYWNIKENSIIEENCTMDRRYECGRGINCSNLDWVRNYNKKHKNLPIWKMLIKRKWLKGVVVPYITDGKIRCNKAQLLNIIE